MKETDRQRQSERDTDIDRGRNGERRRGIQTDRQTDIIREGGRGRERESQR